MQNNYIQKELSKCPPAQSDNIHNFDNDNYVFNDNENIYACDQKLKRIDADLCNLLIYGCTFNKLTMTKTQMGGALYLSYPSLTTLANYNNKIENCTFSECNIGTKGESASTSGGHGGAIYITTNMNFNSLIIYSLITQHWRMEEQFI